MMGALTTRVAVKHSIWPQISSLISKLSLLKSANMMAIRVIDIATMKNPVTNKTQSWAFVLTERCSLTTVGNGIDIRSIFVTILVELIVIT